MITVELVGGVGIEPTQPMAPDLQSGVTLQLHRPPKNVKTIPLKMHWDDSTHAGIFHWLEIYIH